jgi:hypothetical protein
LCSWTVVPLFPAGPNTRRTLLNSLLGYVVVLYIMVRILEM